jgi:TonB family protein
MELSRKSDRWYALVVTLAFHGLLLLLFLLYQIITPIPPFEVEPGGGGGLGVELNFGDSPDGMGMENPELLTSASKPSPPSPADDAVMVDENSNDNVVPVVDKVKPRKRKVKELSRPQDGPRITQSPDKPEEESDRRALYPGKKGGNEGKTGKSGNQGSKEGDDPFASMYQGKGGGDGKGKGSGKGGGDGDGDGPGKGSGTGPGISANLLNRKAVSLPKPSYNSEKSGRVVVDITVDDKGNVIKAVAGGRGTTVQDSELFRQAEAAARKAKFNPDNSAPEKQIGTISYNFIRR